MKKTILIVMMACAQIAMAAPSLSPKEVAEANELAKGSGCFSCHALDEKIVGPAYSKVAAKYSDDKDAVATLSQSIRNGSSGKWGRAAMPPHTNMSQDDINFLARWVLTLQK